MIFTAARLIRHDAFENSRKRIGRNGEAGLFEHLASYRILQPFARFDPTPGKRPVANERRIPALNQENPVSIIYKSANTEHRSHRIAPATAFMHIYIDEGLANRRQDFFGMAFDFHFGENLLDFAVRSNHKRGPVHAHVLLSVHAFLFPDPVVVRCFVFGIG